AAIRITSASIPRPRVPKHSRRRSPPTSSPRARFAFRWMNPCRLTSSGASRRSEYRRSKPPGRPRRPRKRPGESRRPVEPYASRLSSLWQYPGDISMSDTTISAYLIQRLQELGARHVFGVPGDYVLGFYKVLEDSDLQVINT